MKAAEPHHHNESLGGAGVRRTDRHMVEGSRRSKIKVKLPVLLDLPHGKSWDARC